MAKPSREYIYGINPAFEVVRAGRRTMYGAFVSNNLAGNPRLRKLVSYLESKQIPIEQVDRKRLFDLSESKEHQGAVLKTSPYPYAAADSLWGRSRLLLLDNVEDPHNVGAILRSAEIFGFEGVLLPDKGVPEIYPSVVKVSAGACEHLSIARECTSNQYTRKALEHHYLIVALDAKGGVDIHDARLRKPDRLLLVVGGEATAVGQYILNTAHHVVRIEQRGRVNSLNASVAAGIAMFALASRTPGDPQNPAA